MTVAVIPKPVTGSSGSGYVWRQLVLPVPVDESKVRSFMAALSGLHGSPFVVFEAIGHNDGVVWRLGTEPWAVRGVHALALAHLPGVRLVDPSQQVVSSLADVVKIDDASSMRLGSDHVAISSSTAVATARFSSPETRPLRTDATETVTRSVLAVLAGTGSQETIRIQLVLGARLTPTRPMERPALAGMLGVARSAGGAASRDVVHSLEEPGFVVTLRIGASASTSQRAASLVRSVAAGLKGLEMPRLRLRLWRSTPKALAQARSSWLLPMQLRISELPGLLAWPVAENLPGVASPHPVVLPPGPTLARNGRIVGEAVAEPGRMAAISPEDSLRHMHVLGPTGVGKSTLMANMVLQDITAGRGVVVIDPKGDLVADIATRVPEEFLDELVILDASDTAPVGINALVSGRDPDLAADVLLGVFHSLYQDAWGPRTHDILHACLLTLARRGDASLVMVPLLLTNPGFRRSIVGREAKRDPLGVGAFWAWFDAISDGERQQAIAPLMNKLRPILMRPNLRAVFGQRQPKFSIEQLFSTITPHGASSGGKRPRVVLVNLAKGVLGEEAAQLLGSIIVALCWQAALGRAALQAQGRRPVMMHIDELQDYLRLPGDLGSALAQARGLGVGFTLAHQHLGQLPKNLLAGIIANARSRVAFNLTGDDARKLAALSGGTLAAEDFQKLPAFNAYATLLAGGELQPPVSVRTIPLGEPLHRYEDIAEKSRQRYGQALTDVEADLSALMDTTPEHTGHSGGRIGRSRPNDLSSDPSMEEWS